MSGIDTSNVIAWVVDGAPGTRGAAEFLAKLCTDLRTAGVPVDFGEAFVRTLHPHIVGRSFAWRRGADVEVREQSFAYLQSPTFKAGPVGEVFRAGQFVRSAERAGEPGLTDYLACPLLFLSGEVHAISFGTRAPGGFDDSQLTAIRSVVPAISRIAEILALSRTAANLLNTYVGHDAGERILSGQIQRGDVDAISAVIWFSDLRGFTAMSSSLQPGEIIRILNDVFDCQVAAIDAHGGEVLKFIGDGLLAMFPIVEGGRSLAALCADALDASTKAFASLAALNVRRAATATAGGHDPIPLRFGLALHVGEVAYGNIGGAARLDFTCIGPAVNLASRLEALTGKLTRDLVVSADFAAATERAMEPIGDFVLKGVAGPQRVFAPR